MKLRRLRCLAPTVEFGASGSRRVETLTACMDHRPLQASRKASNIRASTTARPRIIVPPAPCKAFLLQEPHLPQGVLDGCDVLSRPADLAWSSGDDVQPERVLGFKPWAGSWRSQRILRQASKNNYSRVRCYILVSAAAVSRS